MTHTRQLADHEGEFKGFNPCTGTKCRKCESEKVSYRVWESSDGAYEDYNYKCRDCGHSWWVDGIDS